MFESYLPAPWCELKAFKLSCEWFKGENFCNISSLNPFQMVYHNQVNKETTVLWHYKQTSPWLRTETVGSFSFPGKSKGKNKRRMQLVIRMWARAMSHLHYLRLACHTCSHGLVLLSSLCSSNGFPSKRGTARSILRTSRSTIFSYYCGVQEPLEEWSCWWNVPQLSLLFCFTSKMQPRGHKFSTTSTMSPVSN